MSEHDLLLDDTVGTLVGADVDGLIELVADGVMWRGAPIAGAAWARALPRPAGSRPTLRDRLSITGYLHLDRACYRIGDRWVPAGSVRLRLDSVSAWWLRGAPGGLDLPPGPAERGRAAAPSGARAEEVR